MQFCPIHSVVRGTTRVKMKTGWTVEWAEWEGMDLAMLI